MRLHCFLIVLLLGVQVIGYGQNADSVASRRVKYRYVAQETGLFSPLPEEVVPGHYSGITYLGGTGYAAVDDKLPGNGLVFFNIDINDLGQVQSVEMQVPDCTSESEVKSKDCEGIAYVSMTVFADSLIREWKAALGMADSIPAIKGNTLFISAESDQSITEYDMDGNPTGRALEIPSEFRKDNIYPNRGFEALTYSSSTSLFWTTTEAPLKSDGEYSLLHRFQSFDASLKPWIQYLYYMDEPIKSQSESKNAQAYVHGISALAALNDGKLVVLEREAYVPKGGILKMALESFSMTKLYLVDPQDAIYGPGLNGELPKTLLCSFMTGALGLANYEGMCLGPVLPNGRQTLVLIADSQGGSKGRILEYVKVIALQTESYYEEE